MLLAVEQVRDKRWITLLIIYELCSLQNKLVQILDIEEDKNYQSDWIDQHQIHLSRILHLDIKPENFIEVFESHFLKRYFVFVGQFVIHYDIQGRWSGETDRFWACEETARWGGHTEVCFDILILHFS